MDFFLEFQGLTIVGSWTLKRETGKEHWQRILCAICQRLGSVKNMSVELNLLAWDRRALMME
jgi:hypothetical protein